MVIELHVALTPLMTAIQTAVLDIVHFCVKEVKRLNPSVSFYNLEYTSVPCSLQLIPCAKFF